MTLSIFLRLACVAFAVAIVAPRASSPGQIQQKVDAGEKFDLLIKGRGLPPLWSCTIRRCANFSQRHDSRLAPNFRI